MVVDVDAVVVEVLVPESVGRRNALVLEEVVVAEKVEKVVMVVRWSRWRRNWLWYFWWL
jgi:hypothetical protein